MERIESKVSVPEIFHQLLPRNGIADIIDGASLHQAVCLIAPYGCGKTLSVVSWLRERGLSAAWLTLDESDNSESAFFAGLSAAVMHLSGQRAEISEILSDTGFIDNPRSFFRSKLPENEGNVIVIDNFRYIKDPGLQLVIKNTIAELLGRWRVIIIGRAEMPPSFNDLLLKRHICLITPAELTFSAQEISTFFELNGCTVSESEVLRVKDETDGWPASLNVILTISRGAPVLYGDTARGYVMDFFETEIWNDLNAETKDFLLKTSVLEKLTPVVCNAVTDIGATLPILRRLYVNGMFISRIDSRDSYYYHRVFREFLRHKLSESDIDELELHSKIGWRLFETGENEKAFTYFFKAGELYGLSRVLRRLNPANMGIERYLELMECITSLNAQDLKAYPVIVSRMAMINYLTGNIDELQRLYNLFLEWIEPGRLPISAEEYAEYVWEAGWLSYLNPAEPVLENKRHEEWCNYREYVPHLKELHLARGAFFRFPSILRGIRDYSETLGTLEDFAEYNKSTGYSVIREETALMEIDILRAERFYELEQFSRSEELVRAAMSKAEAMNRTDLYFVCSALLARLLRAAHDPNEIEAIETRLEAMIHKTDMCFMLPNLHAFQLRNRLAAGHTGFTPEFERENMSYMEKPYFYLLYRDLAFIRALLSLGRLNEAMLMLGNLEHTCIKYARTIDAVEVNVLKAIACKGLNRGESAQLMLGAALNATRGFGFVRIFSDDAKELMPLLETLYTKTKDTYVRNIIISCKKTLTRAGIKPHRSSHLLSELTRAELKILKTLNADMSYEEIAQDNGIKISTVKSHIHSIYSKLDVSNRTSAIIAARAMGIIE